MPDADGCLDNDLSARHSTFSGDTAWPDKSPPSNLEWPITGLPAPSPNCPLTNIRASIWRAAQSVSAVIRWRCSGSVHGSPWIESPRWMGVVGGL